MHGPLDEIGLIEVLQLLGRGRRSGVLRVSGPVPGPPSRIHLAMGRIVAVEPDASDAATVAALADRWLIAPTDAADDPSLLRGPLAETMRGELATRALGTMMHWQRGRFDFEEASVASGPLSIAADPLVVALVAGESQRVELARMLHDFHAVPDFVADDLLAAGPPVMLTPRDWRVLDQVDGVRDVAALAAAVDEPLEVVGACIRSLEAAAILELRVPAGDSAGIARAAIEAGRYEEAATMLRQRLTDRPDDVDAWRALGLAEVGAGRFEQAIDAWQSWRDADPRHAEDAVALMQAARTMVEALRDSRE